MKGVDTCLVDATGKNKEAQNIGISMPKQILHMVVEEEDSREEEKVGDDNLKN